MQPITSPSRAQTSPAPVPLHHRDPAERLSRRRPLARRVGCGPCGTLSPEQCTQLQKERRTYRATEKTAGYVSGASAVLTGIFLAFMDAKAAPAASAGVTLAASSVSVFAGSQVTDLDDELANGQCSR